MSDKLCAKELASASALSRNEAALVVSAMRKFIEAAALLDGYINDEHVLDDIIFGVFTYGDPEGTLEFDKLVRRMVAASDRLSVWMNCFPPSADSPAIRLPFGLDGLMEVAPAFGKVVE